MLFFKEDMTDIFCELLAIKEPKPMLQIKGTTLQNYQKLPNQNTKKSRLVIDFLLFSWTREMGTDNFSYLNSSLFYSISIF